MAVVIPPGFIRGAYELRNAGDPESWFVTLAFDAQSAGGEFEAVLDAGLAAWVDNIQAGFSTATTLVGLHGSIGQDGGPPLTIFAPAGVAGSSSSAKLPQNCAALVRKNTVRAGRPGKGRMFLPNYLDESAVNNVGVIDGGELTAIQAALDSFWSDLTDSGGTQNAAPTLLHNAGIPGGTTPSSITGFQLDSVIATQRRRLRR